MSRCPWCTSVPCSYHQPEPETKRFVEVRDEPLCDFCSSPCSVPVTWVGPPAGELSRTPVADGYVVSTDADGQWYACAPCDAAIVDGRERGNVAALVNRVCDVARQAGTGRLIMGALLTEHFAIVARFTERRAARKVEGPHVLHAEGSDVGLAEVKRMRDALDEELKRRR